MAAPALTADGPPGGGDASESSGSAAADVPQGAEVDRGLRFVLVGVPPAFMDLLTCTRIIDRLDPADLHPLRPEVVSALDGAVAEARRRIG